MLIEFHYTFSTGEGGWFVIFRLFKSILFWSIEFHSTFSISYQILPYYVNYYSILMRMWYRGRVDDLSFFEYLSPFCVVSIEYHCTFSISYKILPYFVYSDKLSPVSSSVFPKGSVTGCDSSLGGGWMIFHFGVFKSILFFVNWNSLYFFQLLYITNMLCLLLLYLIRF